MVKQIRAPAGLASELTKTLLEATPSTWAGSRRSEERGGREASVIRY
jgi:hypothetical protein